MNLYILIDIISIVLNMKDLHVYWKYINKIILQN